VSVVVSHAWLSTRRHPVGATRAHTGRMPLSLTQRRVGRWFLALALVAPPALLAVGAFAVFGGPVGSLAPLAAVALLVVAVVIVRLSPMSQAWAVVREVSIGLVSVLAGIGTWLAMIAVGIGADIMPFIGSGSYPHATTWMLLSTLMGLAAVPLAWWLARRAVLFTREVHEAPRRSRGGIPGPSTSGSAALRAATLARISHSRAEAGDRKQAR
jgi:hypothetical protein